MEMKRPDNMALLAEKNGEQVMVNVGRQDDATMASLNLNKQD